MDYLTKSVVARYSQKEEVDYWSKLEKGLSAVEDDLVRKYFTEKEKKVLVIGCGGGRESLSLSKMDFEVFGLDLVFPLVEAAKKRCLNNSANIPFINADAINLPFKDYSFDFVTMFCYVFPRIPRRNNRIKALTEIKQVLKPDGIFILSIFNVDFIPNLFWFLKRTFRDFRRLARALKHNQWEKIKPILKDMIYNFIHWKKLPFYVIYAVLLYIKNRFYNIISNKKQFIEMGDIFLRCTSPTTNRIRAFFHISNIKEIIQDITAAGLEIVDLRGAFEPKEELSLNNHLSLGDPAIYLVAKRR